MGGGGERRREKMVEGGWSQDARQARPQVPTEEQIRGDWTDVGTHEASRRCRQPSCCFHLTAEESEHHITAPLSVTRITARQLIMQSCGGSGGWMRREAKGVGVGGGATCSK